MKFLRSLIISALFLFIAQARTETSYLSDLDNYAFKQTKTNSLIIQYKGKIIFQKYSDQWTADKPHLLWSMSKSIINQLIGIAVYEGRLTLEESICVKLPELKESPYCKITIDNLLSFASGLKWNEAYEESITESSPISMLYGKNPNGMAAFVLTEPHTVAQTPGSLAMYSSGDSVLLSKILQRTYSTTEYATLPWKKWAEKIGISSLVFEQDRSGNFVGSSSAYLTAQDTLKWGQFLLNNGTVGNTQILPKWWMSHSTEVTPAYLKGRMITSPEDRMSRQWWINRSVPSLNADKAWGNAPEDTYAASGHWGQRLIVIPSEDMIIVRYGEDKEEGTFKTNTLLRLARQLAQNRTLPDIDTSEANAHLVTEHYDPGLSYGGWPKKLAEIKLFGAYKAKEYCSCFYVMKQTAEYCKEFVKNKAVPGFLAPLRHNEKQKEVGVNSHTARFISEQYGCKLIN